MLPVLYHNARRSVKLGSWKLPKLYQSPTDPRHETVETNRFFLGQGLQNILGQVFQRYNLCKSGAVTLDWGLDYPCWA